MKLQPQDQDRFKFLKDTIHNGMVACLTVGSALREIKQRQWYLADGYEDFESFCNGEWGWTKRYCNQLIVDADVINSLPEKMRKLITSHDAARALASVPAPLREIVVDSCDESKPVTAAAIRKALPPPPKKAKPAKEETGPLDETGIEIPVEIRGLWEETGNESRAIVATISALISKLQRLRESASIGYVELDYNQDMAGLRAVFRDVQRGIPHAVCPSCQGKAAKCCETCKGRGFVSKFFWDTCVADEVKKMREAA